MLLSFGFLLSEMGYVMPSSQMLLQSWGWRSPALFHPGGGSESMAVSSSSPGSHLPARTLDRRLGSLCVLKTQMLWVNPHQPIYVNLVVNRALGRREFCISLTWKARGNFLSFLSVRENLWWIFYPRDQVQSSGHGVTQYPPQLQEGWGLVHNPAQGQEV